MVWDGWDGLGLLEGWNGLGKLWFGMVWEG